MAKDRKSTCRHPLLVMQGLAYQEFQKTGLVPDRNSLIEKGTKVGVCEGTASTQAGEFRKELQFILKTLTTKELLSKLNSMTSEAIDSDQLLLSKFLNRELTSKMLSEESLSELLSQKLIRKLFSQKLISQELFNKLNSSDVNKRLNSVGAEEEEEEEEEEENLEAGEGVETSTEKNVEPKAEESLDAEIRVLKEIEQRPDLTSTEREILGKARVGQSIYRKRMLELWNGRCAVTGLDMQSRLTASHAKPWASSSHKERLDPCNGLPLVAALDDLFNDYLISFHPETAKMHISNELDYERRRLLCLPWMEKELRKVPNAQQAVFLKAHFDVFLKRQVEAIPSTC